MAEGLAAISALNRASPSCGFSGLSEVNALFKGLPTLAVFIGLLSCVCPLTLAERSYELKLFHTTCVHRVSLQHESFSQECALTEGLPTLVAFIGLFTCVDSLILN